MDVETLFTHCIVGAALPRRGVGGVQLLEEVQDVQVGQNVHEVHEAQVPGEGTSGAEWECEVESSRC